MQSNGARAGLGVALVAVAVVLFIVLSGGDDDGGWDTTQANTPPPAPTAATGATGSTDQPSAAPAPAPAPQVPTIVVENGAPVGGVQELTFQKGERVRFKVRSDVADEVHVHGYDITEEVAAGGTVSFDFPADLDGIYEAELEQRAEQLVELRIEP